MNKSRSTLAVGVLLAAATAAVLLMGSACTKEVVKEVPVVTVVPTVVTQEVTKEVVKEVTLPLSTVAQKVRDGQIDVGKSYGMSVDGRYHTIHVQTLGLACGACHTANPDTTTQVFSGQDVSPAAPGPVDRRGCLGCHQAGGPARTLYGSNP